MTSKFSRLYPVFNQNGFEFNNKKGLFIVEKWEILVIRTIIILIRSSERIFNPSRYTGLFVQHTQVKYNVDPYQLEASSAA